MFQDKTDHKPEEMDETQEPNEKPYTFSDEPTKKKIKRHLSDIHDVITENDIKNVKIPGKEKPVKPRRGKKDASNNKPDEDVTTKPVEDGSQGSPVTPWDILNE